MKAVCERYGALLILDEVMSGMGRCGTLHAWEQEDVIPDLQTIGKGQEENLLENIRNKGIYWEAQLKGRLGDHPYVGDIRGKGLFWGVSLTYLENCAGYLV